MMYLLYSFSILCILFSTPFAKGKQKLIEKTLAIVENNMISLSDLAIARARVRNNFMSSSVLYPLYQNTDLSRNRKSLLDFLANELVVDLVGKQLPNLQVSEAEITSEIENQRSKKPMSKKQFSRLLVNNYFSSKSYKDFIKKSLLRRKLIQFEVIENIKLTDEDLNNYALRQGKKPLFNSFKYDLQFLVFPTNEEGESLANSVLKTLSLNPNTPLRNISRGTSSSFHETKNIESSKLQKKVRTALNQLSSGQYTTVLSLPSGLHIFKILKKEANISPKNRHRRDQLFALLFQKIYKQNLKIWLNKKRSEVFLKIHS